MLLSDNKSYIIHKTYDVSAIIKRLPELPPETWLVMPDHVVDMYRKNKLDKLTHIRENELSCTRIRIRCHDEDWVPGRYRKIFSLNEELTKSHYNHYAKEFKENFVDEILNNCTNEIVKDLENMFDGIAARVLYAKLPAQDAITPHIDPGYYMGVVHRCHIPIMTNDKVDFNIGETTVNMKVGVMYEINNKIKHSVYNNGDTDRIHLIIDIIPRDKYPK